MQPTCNMAYDDVWRAFSVIRYDDRELQPDGGKLVACTAAVAAAAAAGDMVGKASERRSRGAGHRSASALTTSISGVGRTCRRRPSRGG